jgi:hypothetical protein
MRAEQRCGGERPGRGSLDQCQRRRERSGVLAEADAFLYSVAMETRIGVCDYPGR